MLRGFSFFEKFKTQRFDISGSLIIIDGNHENVIYKRYESIKIFFVHQYYTHDQAINKYL